MNAIAITVISVVGTALFGMFFMQFQNLREDMRKGFENTNARFDRLEDKIGNNEAKIDTNTAAITDLEIRMTDKVTGAIKDLEVRMTDKFTGELKAQGERIDRIHDVLRGHGERLARIEFKLNIDPPAEAA